MMQNKNHYVVVFVFDELCKHVMLVEKQKPDYLRGKWNGVGGKVEETDDSIFHAARRECMEESGIDLYKVNMEHIVRMMFYENLRAKIEYHRPKFIDFVMAKTDIIFSAQTMEQEKVEVLPIVHALQFPRSYPLVSNLYWILPFAIDKYRTAMLHCEEVQR